MGEMIESVQAQTYGDYEHIIIDDGSTDNSAELLNKAAELDRRIRVITQENKGRSAARNIGLDAAAGEYICFLDSDDFWYKNHLQAIHEASVQSSEPTIFVTNLTWYFENRNDFQKVVYEDRRKFTSDTEFVIANQFAPDCVAVHSTLIESERFDDSIVVNEDLELWARLTLRGPVESVDDYTAVLRVHGQNTHDLVDDHIEQRLAVLEKQLNNDAIRARLSTSFIRDRKRSLKELLIRQHTKRQNRFPLMKETVSFLCLYPTAKRNKAKLVTLLYAILGGRFLRRLERSS